MFLGIDVPLVGIIVAGFGFCWLASAFGDYVRQLGRHYGEDSGM